MESICLNIPGVLCNLSRHLFEDDQLNLKCCFVFSFFYSIWLSLSLSVYVHRHRHGISEPALPLNSKNCVNIIWDCVEILTISVFVSIVNN